MTLKIRNEVGCSIDGIDESELEKFKLAGWMLEKEYLKLHPEESK